MSYGLGMRLKNWRIENNLSRIELAEKINYSDKAIMNWELGKALPSYDAIISLSKVMGVSIDWLLGQSTTWKPSDLVLKERHRIPIIGSFK